MSVLAWCVEVSLLEEQLDVLRHAGTGDSATRKGRIVLNDRKARQAAPVPH